MTICDLVCKIVGPEECPLRYLGTETAWTMGSVISLSRINVRSGTWGLRRLFLRVNFDCRNAEECPLSELETETPLRFFRSAVSHKEECPLRELETETWSSSICTAISSAEECPLRELETETCRGAQRTDLRGGATGGVSAQGIRD